MGATVPGMKKLLIVCGLLLGTAGAQTAKARSQCDVGATKVASIQGSYWVYARWTQAAEFPNPSKEMKAGGSGKDYNANCPTYKIDFSLANGEYVFTGNSFNDIVNYSGLSLYDYVSSIDFYDNSGEGGVKTVGVTYNKSKSSFVIVTEKDDSFVNLPIGYRVDGGSLKPLYFEGKTYSIDLPNGAKMLEIYASSGAYTAWQYMKVDLGNNVLTLKHTYPFPSK